MDCEFERKILSLRFQSTGLVFIKTNTNECKVFRQFKKFITKAVDEISFIDLFYINYILLNFLVKLKFCVLD